MKKLLLFSILLFSCLLHACSDQGYGTYVKVIEKAADNFELVTREVEYGLTKAGWSILNRFDSGVPAGCKFRSRVIVFSSDEYAKTIMENGAGASFAMPLKVNVYEDETGVHVAMVNPASINRTIIHETKLDPFSIEASKSIADAIAASVRGSPVKKQAGELRDKGRIGGYGGGDFQEKIKVIYTSPDDSDAAFHETVEGVKNGLLNNNKQWKLVYTYGLSALGPVIFGVTKPEMEGRVFKIAGERRSSGSYMFPGIDHGAAFPIEVIVYKEGGKVKVVTLDETYRMRLYFEDAGIWAFIMNMKLPGEIEKEVAEISMPRLDK